MSTPGMRGASFEKTAAREHEKFIAESKRRQEKFDAERRRIEAGRQRLKDRGEKLRKDAIALAEAYAHPPKPLSSTTSFRKTAAQCLRAAALLMETFS